MDMNLIRVVVTVASFLAFVSIVAWAFTPRARKGFEEAARLPFEEDRPGHE